MNRKEGFSQIAVILIAVGVIIIGGGLYFILNAPRTNAPEQGTNDADLRLYSNTEFGFSFEYPSYLSVSSTGPNDTEVSLESGKQVSGTVAPILDTIAFNQASSTLFSISVFPKDFVSNTNISTFNGYGTLCDQRWIDSKVPNSDIVLTGRQQLPVHGLQVIEGGPRGGVYKNGCFYFKNTNGNLIAFNIDNPYSNNDEFNQLFNLIVQKVIPTLNLE